MSHYLPPFFFFGGGGGRDNLLLKLTMKTKFNSEEKILKYQVVVHIYLEIQNLVISRGYLEEDGKEMYRDV